MIIIPIGHEKDTVRRLPWITFGIMAICFIIHVFISMEVNKTNRGLESTVKELVRYYFEHPYLKLDPETQKLMFGERRDERIDAWLNIYRQRMSRPGQLYQKEEQAKLDQLSQRFKDILKTYPYRKWGFIPVEKSLAALLTYMFIHGGWFHLLGNLLFLYLTGPFIEDVWGRPFFTGFYVVMGALSALMYAQHYPNFSGPLIGASGAIAGVMGAFLIRYWKIKLNFFYLIGFFFRGTFQAPAYIMLPLWVLLEIFNARIVDSINPQGGGVAHWVHVWGFVFGVAVALGMKALRIEEKYVHPKIEARIQGDDAAFDTVLDAIQKKNAGRADEAFALLLGEARKNPMRKDVVETLWDVGVELGRAEESAKFFVPLIENEVRHNQMDDALKHFLDLKTKAPHAEISPTYKFGLMKYLIEHKDFKKARELALELLEELNLDSSPVVLQSFADMALKLSLSLAKEAIELCLQHPEIPTAQKDRLQKELDFMNEKRKDGDGSKAVPNFR